MAATTLQNISLNGDKVVFEKAAFVAKLLDGITLQFMPKTWPFLLGATEPQLYIVSQQTYITVGKCYTHFLTVLDRMNTPSTMDNSQIAVKRLCIQVAKPCANNYMTTGLTLSLTYTVTSGDFRLVWWSPDMSERIILLKIFVTVEQQLFFKTLATHRPAPVHYTFIHKAIFIQQYLC